MASNTKTTRECTRAPKCSILLSNVLAITLSPCSLDADQDTTGSDPVKPQPPWSGKKLYDSFVDNNKSTLHTGLNESLAEIRFAGWIQPFTLLIKGPQEDLEVLTEAWRRRFLRSPDHFTLREIGIIKSIDTEVIQQAPFLPLTKAVYEAISALNKNNLPSGQKQVFEYLAHTYQYVHVPKPNVIRDCLGILFKEGKVYATENNEYFVFLDTNIEKTEREKKEPEVSIVRERHTEQMHPCSLCEEEKLNPSTHARNKRSSKHIEHAHLCEKHKLPEKSGRRSSSSKESSSRDMSKESKELKSEKKEKKIDENCNKKQKEKGNKKTVWGQIAGFMKGKSSHDTPHNDNARPTIAGRKGVDAKTPSTVFAENPESIVPVENTPKQRITKEEEKVAVSDVSSNEKQVGQFQRSRSFTAGQSKNRPDFNRTNSFTGNNSKPKAADYDILKMRKPTEPTIADISVQQGQSSSRDSDKSSTAEKTLQRNTEAPRQKNSTCAVSVEKTLQRTTEAPRQKNSTCAVSVEKTLQRTTEAPRQKNSTCAVGVEKPLQRTTEAPRQKNSTCAVGVEKPLQRTAEAPRQKNSTCAVGVEKPLKRTAEAPRQKNSTCAVGIEKSLQRTTEAPRQKNSTCAIGVVRPWNAIVQNSRADSRPVSRSSSMKDTRRMVSSSSTPTSDLQRSLCRDSEMVTPTGDFQHSVYRANSKIATPTRDFQRSVSRDSKMSGPTGATPTGDIQRFRDPKSVVSSSPTGDFQHSIYRADSKMAPPSRDFQRSVSRDSKMSGPATPTGDIQRFKDPKSVVSSSPTGDFQHSIYRADSKIATPSRDFQRSVSRDSKMSGPATPTGDIQRFKDPKSVASSSSTLTSGHRTPVSRDSKLMGSLTPTGDMQRPVMRDPRSVTRSLSLRDHRMSDITAYQRTHVNLQRDFLAKESPLKHILTKNTGNTLLVSPNHPNYIPAATTQDRTRPSAENRNSFPISNSFKRASWRTTPKEYTDERDYIGPTAKGLLLDENLRKHDEMFSPIQYLHQDKRMVPCDCSDAGYSENSCSRVLSDSTEQKSVSSDHHQSPFFNKHKNEHSSSIYSNSDNGILLDEISSSCSSEIRSIMNQDNKLGDNQTRSPYTVAKGEVVLDSSLTFIGII